MRVGKREIPEEAIEEAERKLNESVYGGWRNKKALWRTAVITIVDAIEIVENLGGTVV